MDEETIKGGATRSGRIPTIKKVAAKAIQSLLPRPKKRDRHDDTASEASNSDVNDHPSVEEVSNDVMDSNSN